MATPLILKGIPLLRLRLQRYNRLFAGTFSSPWGPCCATSDQTGIKRRKWKDKEEEILRDIEPIISLVKEILHSDRLELQILLSLMTNFGNKGLSKGWGTFNVSDEETVLEKLLRHHPHSEDKIGCGLDSIMYSIVRMPVGHFRKCGLSEFYFNLNECN
ncbi:hypothetical protein F3Y22_tig00116968pilonHSYRG00058 [Hibiscus syriacus]|uniref:Uncharacterized protein n=1 Tax=Hibiscus syriacus TaxID=106335 RepID=A0A6A2WJS5_HIBSY|nr:hypothetical protein F3Y22_tig00116968pilonHSYRG00058 [Hibiscus syriacus]